MKQFLANSFVIILLFLPLVINSVDATSNFAFNITPVQVTWTKINIPTGTRMIIGDSTNDGIADYIYTNSSITHYVKQFGTGVSAFDISSGVARDVTYVHSNRVLAWYQPVTTTHCNNVVGIQWNVLTGLNITATQLSDDIISGDSRGAEVGLINKNNQTALMCKAATNNVVKIAIHDTPNRNESLIGVAPAVLNNGIMGIQGSVTGPIVWRTYLFTNTMYSEINTTSDGKSVSSLTYPMINTNNLLSSTTNFGTFPPTQAQIIIDPSIQKYVNGSAIPTTSVLNFNTHFYTRLTHPNLSNVTSLIINFPPFLLNPAFVSQPTYFVMNDGVKNYMAAILSNNLYYTDYTTLVSQITSNRAFANYIIDPANKYLTISLNGTLPTGTPITLTNRNGSSYTYRALEQTVLISGYYWNVPNQLRYYYPDFTNSLAQMPTDTFTSANAIWTLIINNSPQPGSIMISNSTNYNGTNPYVNSVTFLQSDRSTTTNLVNNACYNIYIADSSLATPVWLFEGTTCANGVNPKTIAFTNTLPSTFYTMGAAATHSFTPSNNALSTTVRDVVTPFTYNVIVKNSTGAVTINQTFTSNSTLDTRNFNVSNTAKSAGLFISVTGTGLIYSAYLGSPLSFASMASFFHQYFSYQGFDFLSFIPLIFASMFTRNTVGIGATLTVVLIATLSWLSVVVVSDTVIFIMMVIAILGLIGYRGLYG